VRKGERGKGKGERGKGKGERGKGKGERGKGKMICVRKSAWEITYKDHPPSCLLPKTPHHCNLAICPETENSTDCATTIPVDLSVSAESGGGATAGGADMEKYSCLLRDLGLMFQELRRVDA